jgi:hypothetical protein
MAAANLIAPALTAKDIARFWAKVQIAGPDDCWLWTAAKSPKGYGRFGAGYRTYVSHSLARFIVTGEWRDGLLTLHNCPNGDNPSCCNPAHLWLGTDADNVADMVRKGRQCPGDRHPLHLNPLRAARGERSGTAKLTTKRVLRIRSVHAARKYRLRELAKRFKISHGCLLDIICRRTWRHI